MLITAARLARDAVGIIVYFIACTDHPVKVWPQHWIILYHCQLETPAYAVLYDNQCLLLIGH